MDTILAIISRIPALPLMGALSKLAIAVHGVCMAGLAGSVTCLATKPSLWPVALALGALSGLGCLAVNRAFPANKAVQVLTGRKDGGLALIGSLMENFFAPVINRAKREKIPILDLPNTLNPLDGKLFRSQIEPSKDGGKLIAAGISAAVTAELAESSGAIYSKRSNEAEYVAQPNTGGSRWRVDYPMQPAPEPGSQVATARGTVRL